MYEAAGSHLKHVSGLVLNGEMLAPDLHPMKAEEQTKYFCRLAHPLNLEATKPGSTAGGMCLEPRGLTPEAPGAQDCPVSDS